MSAQVSQQSGPDSFWLIRFFIPAEWMLEGLPEPNDESVKLVAVPAETVAVLRFGGVRGPRRVASRTAGLLRALQGGV